jgi:hypothetical protein
VSDPIVKNLRRQVEDSKPKPGSMVAGLQKATVNICDLEGLIARYEAKGRPRMPQSMDTAPKDGTHILAYLFFEGDDCGTRPFGEWREIFFREYTIIGMRMPWHAGNPFDAHDRDFACEHFGIAVPICWLPLPEKLA